MGCEVLCKVCESMYLIFCNRSSSLVVFRRELHCRRELTKLYYLICYLPLNIFIVEENPFFFPGLIGIYFKPGPSFKEQ